MTKILLTECPACGYRMDRVSGVFQNDGLHRQEKMPEQGNLTVCIQCGAICEFDENLVMKLVPTETCQRPEYAIARRVQAAVVKLRNEVVGLKNKC